MYWLSISLNATTAIVVIWSVIANMTPGIVEGYYDALIVGGIAMWLIGPQGAIIWLLLRRRRPAEYFVKTMFFVSVFTVAVILVFFVDALWLSFDPKSAWIPLLALPMLEWFFLGCVLAICWVIFKKRIREP